MTVVAVPQVSQVVVDLETGAVVPVTLVRTIEAVPYPVPSVQVVTPGPQGPPGEPGPPGEAGVHDHTPEQVGFHVGPTAPVDTSLIWIQTPA